MRRNVAKTVLRTAIVRNASTFTLKNAAYVMMALLFITIVFGCAKEDLKPTKAAAVGPAVTDSIKEMTDHWDKSVKSLVANAIAHDSLCYSWVEFAMQSIMKYSTQDGVMYSMNFSPEASLNIRLTPARQEVANELELPTYRTKRETIYDAPINEGLYLGRKFKLRDTQADGSIAEIEATWRCLGIITAEGDTVLPPHIEFSKDIVLDSIHVEKFGEQTELDKPHKVVHCYTASYTSKGVSDQEKTMKVQLRPWRIKSITDVEQVLTGTPSYKERWIGCPITAYELTQTAPTNKGNVVTTKQFPVSLKFNAPEAREQASLDSLFAAVSTGKTKAEVLGDSTKNEDGFIALTYSGTHNSKNVGTENSSVIESTTSFTYTIPVKFVNKWGSYDIKAPELSFEEGGFTKESVSEDADFHIWKTVNTIIPTFGTCTMDAIDEVVKIKVGKEKPIIVVDSVYVYGGKGDSYPTKKIKYFSDGSILEFDFSYDGHHSASVKNFGEKVTSNLNWNAGNLKGNGSSKDTEKKEFTKTTYYEVINVTENSVSDASNGSENGQFGFTTVHQIVTFVDGDTRHTWDERKVVLSGKGAQPAANYTLTVKDGISYKGYTYNMSAGVIFDGEAEADVTSQGLLLIVADVVGEAQYQYDYSWSGNTITVKTTKTIPHSFGEDEVEVYQTSYTVSMTDLENGKVYAENVDFTVKANNSEKSLEPVKDGFYTITPRERGYSYNVSNGTVSREMSNTVVDAVIVFNDGTGNHTWDASLAVSKSDSFGEARNDGDYKVTPLTTTVKAVAQGTNAPTLTVSGTTDIYVEQDKIGDTSYKPEESWNGNTFTAKVTRTIKHTKANDEVKPFDKSVTVSMSDLQDGRVDAENTSFTVKPSNSEKSDDDKDGNWTVTKRVRSYTYVVSNGSASRQMTNEVVDYTIVFKDGDYTHTFNAQLNVSNSDKFGTAKTEGDYTVTPLTTTVKAVGNGTGAPTITKSGVTNIYVENPKEISYRFTYKVDDVDNGTLYADMLAERLVNGKVEKKWSCWGLAGKWGEYKPNVSGIWVTNINFRDNFSTTDHATDKGAEGLGDAKAFSMANISKIENHLSVLFDANADADGNTTREVAGHINLWSYRYTFVDPDNGHKETLDFVITAKTTTHEVKNNVYHRVVEIQLNGQTVATQEGKVNVTVE